MAKKSDPHARPGEGRFDGPKSLDRSDKKHCYVYQPMTSEKKALIDRAQARVLEQQREQLERQAALAKRLQPEASLVPRAPREPRIPKRPSREGLVGIAVIAKEMKLIPRIARAALRSIKYAKPPQGWAFAPADIPAVKAAITKGMIPCVSSSKSSSTLSPKKPKAGSRITAKPKVRPVSGRRVTSPTKAKRGKSRGRSKE